MRKIIAAFAVGAFLIPAVSLAAFDQNLSYGASGPAVTSLQTFLTAQGFYSGPITGNFLGLTKSALISFQKQNGIQPASGFFGPLTRKLANDLSSSNEDQATSTTASQTQTMNTNSSTQATPPPNTTPCNGTNWNSCPTGQDFVCPANGGKAYCQLQQSQSTQTPTAAQTAQVAQYCSDVQNKQVIYNAAGGNTQITQYCNDGTLLALYLTDATLRNNVDSVVQKVSAQQQSTNAYNQAYVSALSTANTTSQLQQLQNSIDANTRAIQQQQLQQSIPTYTAPPAPAQQKCTTQPWWDAGVLRYTTTCNPISY